MIGFGTALMFGCGMAAATVGMQQPKTDEPKVNRYDDTLLFPVDHG